VKNIERFSTFKPGFSNQNHNLSPLGTRPTDRNRPNPNLSANLEYSGDFARAQIVNALAQSLYWLEVAQEWGNLYPLHQSVIIDLDRAMMQMEILETGIN